ncbi:MAG: nuclear transport factor 2 family protein [Gemmataceae bacterium]
MTRYEDRARQFVAAHLLARFIGAVVLVGFLLCLAPLSAQEDKPKTEDPAHQKLRDLRDRLLASFNKRDIDALLKDVHENVVVTWQNGEVSRGHKGVREFYDKMMNGPQKIVQNVTANNVEADDLTMLSADGKYGVAWGKMDEHFSLSDGKDFDLANRWTASLARDGDEWKVVSLHVSANIFDNGVQNLAIKQVMMYAGGGGLLAGLIVGALITVLLKRRSAS